MKTGGVRRFARRLRFEAADLGALALPAMVGGGASVAVGVATSQGVASALIGLAAVVLVRVGAFLRHRTARDRAIEVAGRAALDVLDLPLYRLNAGTYQLATGESATLRLLAELVRTRALHEDLSAAEAVRFAWPLGNLPAALKQQAALALAELSGLRARAAEFEDALATVRTVADEIGPEVLYPGNPDANAEEQHERVDRIGAMINRAAGCAERLERQWDADAATARATARSENRARIREDRRCAHRAVREAAQSLLGSVGEAMPDTGPWSARLQQLIFARERFAGVCNVEASRMTPRALKLTREVAKNVSAAIEGASVGAEAERSAEGMTRADLEGGAAQLIAVRKGTAQQQLSDARQALETSVVALADYERGANSSSEGAI